MKKLLLVTCLLFYTNCVSAFDFMKNEIVMGKGLALVFESKNEESLEYNYKIELKYPQLSGEALSEPAQNFNEKMKQFTNLEVTEFESKVNDNLEAVKKLPENLQKNTFNLNFNASIFKAKDTILMGIRFNKEYSYAGNAHPSHDIEIYNYDLTSGKEITLNDIFIPGSNYLKVIADYCHAELTKRMKVQNVKLNPQGLDPKIENYDMWNLEPDGLLFIFDEGQVAPYVAGQPEVFITYKTLKSLISPTSPVAVCLKDPKECIAV
jgi:hypothetical protein